MTSRNRATRKRTGNTNTLQGGILSFIDGNARPRRARPSTRTKSRSHPPASPQYSSSSSGSSHDSIQHTLPKTVLVSTLAGSPCSDEDSVQQQQQQQEEEEMSDLSVGTPTSTCSSSNDESLEEENKDSLKRKPLFQEKGAADGAEYYSENDEDDDSQDDDSAGSNESNVMTYQNTYTPDSRRSTSSSVDSSDADSSQDDDDDDSLDSIGLDDEEDSVEEQEGISSEESDDEYVMEEESSIDTEDEDLDADIVVDLPSKRPRQRGKMQTKKQTNAATAKPKKTSVVGKKDKNAQQSQYQSEKETQNVDDKDDDDDDETVQEEENEDSKAESVSSACQENKSPDEEKRKPQKETARKIPILATKNVNTLHKEEEKSVSSSSANKKASPRQEKKASIYKESSEQTLSKEQEMLVVAQVMQGINLDDDDEDVVIAEVVMNGDADANDDMLATVVVNDATETVEQDRYESKDYNDDSDSGIDEEASVQCSENDDDQSFSMMDEIEPVVSNEESIDAESTVEPLSDMIVETCQEGGSMKEVERTEEDSSGLPDETTAFAAVPSPSSAVDEDVSGNKEQDATSNVLYEVPLTSPSFDDGSSVAAKKVLASGDSKVDELPPTESLSPVCGEAFDVTSAPSYIPAKRDSPTKTSAESMGHQSAVDGVVKAMEQSPIQPPSPRKQDDDIDEEISTSPPINKEYTSTETSLLADLGLHSTGDDENVASESEKQAVTMTYSLSPSRDNHIVTDVASSRDKNETPALEKSPPRVSSVSVPGEGEEALEESVPKVVATKPSTDDDDDESRALAEPNRRPRLRRFRSEGSIKRGKWGTGSKIGVGSFGVVRVGMNKKTGTLMAVKSISVSKAVMKDIQTEIDLLKSLDHTNIVRYLGAETDEKYLHIFQEWVPGGSLTSLLHKFGPFSMQVCRSYLFQILSGLSYLHDNRILHRDIKGGNVLVSDSGVVKLADFGSSKRLVQQQLDAMENMTMRGTPYFMAPEVFEEKYGSKADIWSVGCVAFQMATGSPPWKGMGFTNPMSVFLHIKDTEGIPSYEWSNPDQDDTVRFKAMLERCFYRDPSLRPTAKELAADPFFTAFEQSSSDDNQSRGLFSPGGDSLSTWGSARSPKATPARSSPASQPAGGVAFGKASFLSPPLPTRIHQGSYRQDVISPLAPSPVVDTSEWPSWARERLQDGKSPYKMRPESETGGGSGGLPPPSPSKLADSLAVSEGSSIVNPFRRKVRKSGDSSLGTADSLAVSEDSSMVNPFRRKGSRTSGDSSLGSSLVGLDFLEAKSSQGTSD